VREPSPQAQRAGELLDLIRDHSLCSRSLPHPLLRRLGSLQLIAVMLASLFRAIDLPAWQWGLSLLYWVPENAFMWPSRLPIQYHRNMV
jgi:hypothetical protein